MSPSNNISLSDKVFVLLSQKDFESKFKPVERELTRLREKVGVTRRKLGLFKVHKFTREELDQHLSKIESFVEKIGDDVSQWETSEQLTFFEKSLYMKYRNDIQSRLQDIEAMIEDRNPTFWEDVFSLFTNYTSRIMEYLPEFLVYSLPRFLAGRGAKIFRKLLPRFK